MIQTLEENPHFSIRCNTEKNRLYMKMIGFWGDIATAQAYFKQSVEALNHVEPGFTAVIDLSAFKIPKPEIMQEIKKSQKSFMEKGLRKSAELLAESFFTDMAIEKLKQENQMSKDTRKKFSDLEEAEAWLDE